MPETIDFNSGTEEQCLAFLAERVPELREPCSNNSLERLLDAVGKRGWYPSLALLRPTMPCYEKNKPWEGEVSRDIPHERYLWERATAASPYLALLRAFAKALAMKEKSCLNHLNH